MSFVEQLSAKITARDLKGNLLGLVSTEAQEDALLETILSTIAHNTLAERGQKEKGIMTLSLNRAAVLFDENNPEHRNLDKRLDDIRGTTTIFTPHPNYALNKDARTIILEIYDALAENDSWRNVSSGKQDEKIQALIAKLSKNLTKPNKLTVADEWELTNIDAQAILDAIPEAALVAQKARHSVAGREQTQYKVSAEELEKYVGLIEAKSWGLDRDSKPNVTAAVMEAEIKKQIDRTREGYISRLTLVEEQITEAGFTDTANTLGAKIEAFKNGGSAATLAADLLQIKQQHEKESRRLPVYKDGVGNETPFSVLDMAYLQVKTGGECWPKGEIRQNAAMHATAMRHARKLLPQSIKGGANNNDLFAELQNNPIAVQKPINDEIDRLHLLIEGKDGYNEFCKGEKNPDKREAKIVELGITQEEIDFYETFAGLRVASKYPHAIHSYVIAETGVMDKEDFEAKVAARIMDMRHTDSRGTYHLANPKMSDEKVNEMARNEVISEKVKEDLLAVMFMKYMNGGVDYKEKAAADKMEIIPLFESFKSITQGWESMDRLDRNGRFQDYIKHCNRNKLPTITDPETGKSRVMTIADAKRALGMEVKEGDEDREVKAAITVMHAGSDAMRENGLGICSLNTHYQERVQEKLIEQGIWVDIYQGTGAAMHRSHPASPHVARETIQGGVRPHDNIVIRWAKSVATQICNLLGYTLPEEFRDVLAAYPGHMGNSMMLPKESIEVKKGTQPWLDKACYKHSAQFDDPAYEHFFKNATAFDYTKMFNFSARPDGRVGAFALDKVRAIGYSMSLFAAGSNNTLIGGMNEFFGMSHENGYKMGDGHRDEIIGWLKESPKIQEMMTRLTHGVVTANMDSAWAFQGITRTINEEGDVMLTKGDTTVRLDDLLDAKKGEEFTKENVASYKYAYGFGAEALALAEADKEYQTTAKAVYEIYSRMQIELEYEALVAKTPAIAGGHHARRAKDEKLKALEAEIATPYFDPKKIFDIMTPEMREELKDKMKPIDRARMALANHHNKSNSLDENGLYKAFATCMEGFETGAPACLRHTSINFTNDVVQGRGVMGKGSEYSIAI